MDTQLLLQGLDSTQLACEAPALVAWEIGVASNADDVACFMYRDGPFPPQASFGKQVPGEDRRPEKRYWTCVKEEMQTFLCTNDKRYSQLWVELESVKDKATAVVVGIIAAFMGAKLGVPATLISGFVAVCLYAAIKVGKEAYCSYVSGG